MPAHESNETVVMDAEDVRRAITRIAHEILERNKGGKQLAVVGILKRGAPVGKRLAFQLSQIEGCAIPNGSIDVSAFRDDVKRSLTPVGRNQSDITFDLTGRSLILVDEVIYTGRTVRAAMDAVMTLGRPANVQLAVLIDRGHRELPIRPDYVGKNLPTGRNDFVLVKMAELEGEDRVIVVKSRPGSER
ncbi:MAG: bifunctional pyr operon transcriptional regulator/uracil phosphoribosyltransferase PyrR [Armatimonadetes bacterium]|nr:bifunctional pyr operon transcriptional regulator/uracil phosphoribosyltransferase PyrR [Armatimonadota bacterium]